VVLALALSALVFSPRARGDVFRLSQGGQVVGELQNPDQSPRETYAVKTPEGAVVTLARSQVKEVLRPKPEEIEYEEIRSQYPDTADGQWRLAEWCKEHKLNAQRKAHLERAVELDPNHEAAHRALGHSRIDGKWTTQRDFLTSQGYRWYRGRVRTQQEIDILEEKQRNNAAEKEWTQKIDRLVGGLVGDRADEAREALLAIRDPRAAQGLAIGLRHNPRPEVRVILAQALAELNTSEALLTLAARAIEDPVEDVRLTCLELLKKKKNPDVVEYFVGRLQVKSNNNVAINRAGVALRMMGDPSAVGPLIDALVTVHKFKVGSSNPGQMSSTFGTGPGGGGGLAVGGGPRIKLQPIQNRDVLDALVALTGHAGLGFDVPGWRTWFAAQKSRDVPDVRRDK
jgi:hypothetical protein